MARDVLVVDFALICGFEGSFIQIFLCQTVVAFPLWDYFCLFWGFLLCCGNMVSVTCFLTTISGEYPCNFVGVTCSPVALQLC